MFGSLGLGLGLGAHRKVEGAGNKPATFTVTAGNGTKYVRVQVSETTTVTPAGGTSIRIGSSGEFVTTPLILTANTDQDIYFKDAGSFTIPKRKLVTYLYLNNLGSSAITCDITGMKLTSLTLATLGSSVITGKITGMKLTYLDLDNLGNSSVITGDITGMKLTYLYLRSLGLSTITGNITGMNLTRLYIRDIGSSLTYGTNSLNITHNNGIQLLGNTVFSAEGNKQLIIDAAAGTWSHATTRPFTITAGTTATDPGWDTVSAAMTVLKSKTTARIIPAAWLQSNGGTWPANWDA